MVKVTDDDAAMAEPKTATTTTSSPNPNMPTNSQPQIRKPPRPHIHHYAPFQHFTHHHHHHCSLAENHDVNNPTPKFYFGPGFEPQQGGTYPPGPSQGQGNEYVVFFHVNPGVTINLQIGDTLEVLRGPVTVPMVSTNSSPPIAMPVQVPPGHVVQQIVDESGTLRHVILSPQPPAGLVPLPSHNPQHYTSGPPNNTTQPQQFYQNLGFPPHQHFHSNMPPGHPVSSPTHMGHSPPPNSSYFKDERAQRQHIKLKKKLHEKQQKGEILSPRKELVNGLKRSTAKEKGMNSVGTSEDGEESSVPDEEESCPIITDILSSVQAPKVSELSSRSALLQWAAPARLSEAASSDSHEVDISESDLRYEVLLSDKSKEMKFKSIYSGASLSCRIQDLKPGQEYSVCLQVHYMNWLQGSATDPIKFTTPACEPDQPQPPKLINRSKNSLQLKWNAVSDNGSPILYYTLEYDEGKGGEFKEFCKSKGRTNTLLQKLSPATSYRFRLAAVNEKGKSSYSEVMAYSTLDNPPTQPKAPTLLLAEVQRLHLSWSQRPGDEEFVLQMNDPHTEYGHMIVYNGRDTKYTCKDLHYFSEYKFRLRAQNDGGQSPWSEEVTYKTLPACPSRPSKPVVKGRIHAYSFKLKWDPPSDNGGAEISSYTLEVNSGSGYREVYSGIETEAVCDKLTPGTTYQLRVSCVSAGGRSNYSDPCTVTTDAISPDPCEAPRLHGKPKSNSIAIRWQEPNSNGGAPILEYEVEMVSPDASRQIVHKSKEIECVIGGLSPGSQYMFRVRAENRIGPGSWSEYLTVTTGAAPPVPPAIPQVTCKSPFQVLVSWEEPQSNGAPVSDYKLEISTSPNEDQFQYAHQGAQTFHEMKGLDPFTMYYFRVQAANAAGWSGFSPAAATVTPAAPPAIVNSVKSESTPRSITLHWNPPADNGSPILYYNVEIGDNIISTENPENTFTIDELQPDTTYRVKVQAVNSVAAGPFSSTYKIATGRLPPAAPALECISVGHNYLKLKWGEGKNIDYTQYCVEMSSRGQDFQCVYKGTALTCKVNKLSELTNYRFRINASNDAGVGNFSEEYEFVTSISPPAVLKMPKVVELEQHSCVIEWVPSKNTFSDPITYNVQFSKLKEQSFRQVYKGSETKCSIENLDAGSEYCVRICPIRITANGELAGPFSPVLNFSTISSEPILTSKAASLSTSSVHGHKSSTTFNSLLHMMKPKNLLEPSRIIMFGSMLFVIFGIIISMAIKSFL